MINGTSHALRQLEELFLLVVVGEFNAGKSAFNNAARPAVLEEVSPPLPTGPRAALWLFPRAPRDEDSGGNLPVAWLRDINMGYPGHQFRVAAH
jgi:hypothetical protein